MPKELDTTLKYVYQFYGKGYKTKTSNTTTKVIC